MWYKRYSLLLTPDGDGNGGGDGNTPPPNADELKKAIEKARLEERTKLRNELDAANNAAGAAKLEVEKLKTENADLKSKFETLQTDLTNLKASLKADDSTKVDLDAIIKKTSDATAAQYLPRLKQLEDELNAERNQRVQAEFEAEKARRVAAIAAEQQVPEEVLTELVRPISSKEGLDEAIQQKAEILKKSLPPVTTPSQNGTSRAGLPLPSAFTAGAGETLAGKKVSDIRTMPDDEWRKSRSALLKQSMARYTSANPMVRS